MLEANDMVEAKLAEIRERKIYEMKRMFAAKMHEGVGGLTKAEVEARKKAGYKKASDILGDPRKETTPIAGHRFKKIKKKVVEAVDVQPDPEGKVRGGSGKVEKGTFRRKAAAVAIKAGRKLGTVAGNVAIASMRAKAAYDQYKKKKAEPSDDDYRKAAGAEPSQPKATTQRPGMLRRNINTFMGREPGHVDNRTPEEKLNQKGGRVGKVARAVVGAAGRSVGSVVSDLESIGTKHL